ncbi:MAG: site-specific DNA-methyltransferase [Candidatus Contendobacter sp.]
MPLLHWLTREEDIHRAARAPYRLLEEAPDLSHGDRDTGNMLVQGDNLDALKALLPYYAGKVKCIYIDPPYNTRSAFEHYDDNLEHSQWLAMIYPRLELLRKLLSEDGSLWVSIDDNEGHYLKVVMDEVFGRNNFRRFITWQRKYSVSNNFKGVATICDYILLYSKGESFQNKLLPRTEASSSRYSNPDNDIRGAWKAVDYLNQATPKQRPNLCYDIINPNTGEIIRNTRKAWKYDRETHKFHIDDNRLWWGRGGKNTVPALKLFLSEVRDGMTPHNWWPHEETGHTDEAKKEINIIFGNDKVFDTPKPERLINRIFEIATHPGDLVLDSFLGSGTTAAVAHKMGRRYIGIEMGEHAVTHCAPRLRKVIEGEQGGISEAVGWKGGGGFRFYRLGDPVFDEAGHISPGIRFAPLAAHVWFIETGVPFTGAADSPLLGTHDGTAYYLLYNGILGDKRPDGGNVLTAKILAALPPFDGPKVIFGEGCRMSAGRLHSERINFRQIPYEIKAR